MEHLNKDAMFDLADGELDADKRQTAIKHISTCEDCKKRFIEIIKSEMEL